MNEIIEKMKALLGQERKGNFWGLVNLPGADEKSIIPSEYKRQSVILSDSYGRGIQARENLTVVGYPGSSFETFFSIFLVPI